MTPSAKGMIPSKSHFHCAIHSTEKAAVVMETNQGKGIVLLGHYPQVMVERNKLMKLFPTRQTAPRRGRK